MTAYRDANDHELLSRLLLGDVAALDALIQRYWSPLVSYLTRLGGSADAAEDIAQRTFQRVWERRSRLRRTGSVRGLLYRIAHNLAVSEYRAERARLRADAAGAQPRDPVTPLDLLQSTELGDVIDRAVQALPPRRREVFILRCIHDLSYREIAAIMGTSQQTVANQLSRALASLREMLGPQLHDD